METYETSSKCRNFSLLTTLILEAVSFLGFYDGALDTTLLLGSYLVDHFSLTPFRALLLLSTLNAAQTLFSL